MKYFCLVAETDTKKDSLVNNLILSFLHLFEEKMKKSYVRRQRAMHLCSTALRKGSNVFLLQTVNLVIVELTAVFRVDSIQQRTGPGPVF